MLQAVLDLEDERVWTAATGFGGGIGRQQHVCGAITGAVIALGLQDGTNARDPRASAEVVYPRVRKLVQGFIEAFGSAECRLLVPFDFDTEGQLEEYRQSGVKQRKCHLYIQYAVGTVAKWQAEGTLRGAG